MNASTAISAYGFGLSEATHSASAFGIPVNAMHEARNAAPARMKRIMQESLVAPMRLAQNVRRSSPPEAHAIASAPTTPKAADSVAVAQPITITQIMNTMRARQGIR